MNLSYIPRVIQEGEVVVQLTEEDMEEENGVWAQAIVLYVVGNTPSIGTIERFIGSQWNFVQKPKDIIFKGPYSLFNRPVIIKSWAPNFNFKEEVLGTIPLWVKLPNLPRNCWTASTLNKIGSGLGKPLCANAYTSNMEQIMTCDQIVEYKWRPIYCTKCCQVGHVCRDENLPVEKPRGKKVWRKPRVLDPNTNPLIDDKGRYKAQLVGEGEKGKEKVQRRNSGLIL
ncbi:hypothetical protein R3W88_024488 [Solanum pinnatisectum]|uniref:DUF4283 domain-containing protein n=1 Tax=Solanum pinnatisectum TaxID=50273 RepID=A0AAV9M0C5_9SOLN|nr:hypothetical protein R3W88_024488 [Solanum pinnatisectum]